MARIRTIKPEFFRHEGLYDLEVETGLPIRVAFAGLWTACDREGRFEWKPRELKLDCLPHDPVDFSRVLDALMTREHIVRYEVAGRFYGLIPSWHQHQVVNNRETASDLPEPPKTAMAATTCTRASRVDDACPTPLVHAQAEGKGKEGKGKEGRGASAKPQRPPAAPPGGAGTKGARLAADWALPDDWRAYCVERRPDLDPATVAENFRDYWHGRNGREALKADWKATWQRWVRNERQGGAAASRDAGGGQPGWARAAGFANVFDAESAGCGPGNYRDFRNGQKVPA